MFERLIDLIIQFGTRLTPCQIVQVYEGGVVLRFGCYHRTVQPGLAWKWPVIESIFTANTVLTTVRLPPQTLTTKDDIGVVVAAIIKYQVVDVKPYVTEIWDQHDVLMDVTMGAIRQAVVEMNYHDLINGAPEKRVQDAVRAEVNQYGFRIRKITFTDMGKVRSFRLIQQAAVNIDN